MLQVAEVGRAKWLEIGLALGFSMEELDEYEEREPKRLDRRPLCLLVDWEKRMEDPTVGAVVSACNHAGIGGAVKRELHRLIREKRTSKFS